jgi:hypothetical protein
MKKLKCKLGLHDWKYHNEITRQCLNCGITQYKKSLFGWHNIISSYFQPKAKVELDKDTETITIKKGTFVVKPEGWQILNDFTRDIKYIVYRVEKDISFNPKQGCEVSSEKVS